MSADLKPCPMCNSAPELFLKETEYGPEASIYCLSCGVKMLRRGATQSHAQLQVETAWNRRAPTDAEERGRLKGIEEAAILMDHLRWALGEFDSLIAYMNNPNNSCGSYDAECPIAMGEWFAEEDYARIEAIRALAGKTEEKVG